MDLFLVLLGVVIVLSYVALSYMYRVQYQANSCLKWCLYNANVANLDQTELLVGLLRLYFVILLHYLA